VPGETSNVTEAGPLSGANRLLSLDVLRGIALFGILLVNMAFYSLPMFYYPPGAPQWQRPIDRHLDTLIHSAGDTEFLSLFSFLFGLGLALQGTRAGSEKTADRLFFRRIAVLLGFGLFHAFFVWMGDVLIWYAVAALGLYFFRSARPRTLLIAAVLFFVLELVRPEWRALHATRHLDSAEQLLYVSKLQLLEKSLAVYAHGSYSQIFVQRAHDLWFQYSHQLDFLLHVFSIFLLGAYFGRRHIFHNVNKSRKLFIGMWYVGAFVGLGGYLVEYVIGHKGALAYGVITPVLGAVADLSLAAFYMASLILAMDRPRVAKILAPLGCVGRMTLTNYLCQSLICTTLMYSYGFGLYGKLRPLDWLLFALAIYTVQAFISVWWLRRFAYGPAEWLWRTLVYGKRIPMRLPERAVVGRAVV
jgi:uncharacterized protein